MAVQNQDEFRVQVQQELASTPYKATSLTPLTGGTANFIYKATLEQPLPDGTAEVAVKHGQGYVASRPSFAIPTSRCVSCSAYMPRMLFPRADELIHDCSGSREGLS